MSYIKAVYLDLNKCCEDFVTGTELLEQCFHKEASKCFQLACESVAHNHNFFSKYQSYYGFSCVLNGDYEAITICRNAVKAHPFDGDICMNLARAEMLIDNRKKALEGIKVGLRFSCEHVGLQALKIKYGVRKRKPIPFLSRNNPVNVVLGKRMRKNR